MPSSYDWLYIHKVTRLIPCFTLSLNWPLIQYKICCIFVFFTEISYTDKISCKVWAALHSVKFDFIPTGIRVESPRRSWSIVLVFRFALLYLSVAPVDVQCRWKDDWMFWYLNKVRKLTRQQVLLVHFTAGEAMAETDTSASRLQHFSEPLWIKWV